MHAVVQTMLPACQERIARDGKSYTYEEFAEWYGEDADNMWACAAVIFHDYTSQILLREAYRYVFSIEQLLTAKEAELAQTQAELASQKAAAVAANSRADTAVEAWNEAAKAMAAHHWKVRQLQDEKAEAQSEALKLENAFKASDAARAKAEKSRDELDSVLENILCLENLSICVQCKRIEFPPEQNSQ